MKYCLKSRASNGGVMQIDWPSILWKTGVAFVAKSGRSEGNARSLIGKWLKRSKEDHRAVFNLIAEGWAVQHSEDGEQIKLVQYVEQALKPHGRTADPAKLRKLDEEYERAFGVPRDPAKRREHWAKMNATQDAKLMENIQRSIHGLGERMRAKA